MHEKKLNIWGGSVKSTTTTTIVDKNVPQLLDKLEALNNDHVMCFVIFLALHLWGVVLFSYFSTLHLI